MPKKFNIAVVLLLFFSLAQSAEISFGPNQRGNMRLKIEGKILKGDAEKFTRLVIDNPQSSYLELDSPGGNLHESIEIGKIVSALYLETSVKPSGICASACFFIWLDGAKRFGTTRPEYGGKIGLHRPYLANPEFNEKSKLKQNQIQKEMISYLESRFISRSLIDLMMSRPSNDIYWLTKQDIDEIGEYNSSNEEVFVAKCDYNRKNFPRMINLVRDKKLMEAEALASKMTLTNSCIDDMLIPLKLSSRREFTQKHKSALARDLEPSISDMQEREIVQRIYPNVGEIVMSKEFERWLKLQSKEIKRIATESNKATEVIRVLDKFSNDSK